MTFCFHYLSSYGALAPSARGIVKGRPDHDGAGSVVCEKQRIAILNFIGAAFKEICVSRRSTRPASQRMAKKISFDHCLLASAALDRNTSVVL